MSSLIPIDDEDASFLAFIPYNLNFEKVISRLDLNRLSTGISNNFISIGRMMVLSIIYLFAKFSIFNFSFTNIWFDNFFIFTSPIIALDFLYCLHLGPKFAGYGVFISDICIGFFSNSYDLTFQVLGLLFIKVLFLIIEQLFFYMLGLKFTFENFYDSFFLALITFISRFFVGWIFSLVFWHFSLEFSIGHIAFKALYFSFYNVISIFVFVIPFVLLLSKSSTIITFPLIQNLFDKSQRFCSNCFIVCIFCLIGLYIIEPYLILSVLLILLIASLVNVRLFSFSFSLFLILRGTDFYLDIEYSSFNYIYLYLFLFVPVVYFIASLLYLAGGILFHCQQLIVNQSSGQQFRDLYLKTVPYQFRTALSSLQGFLQILADHGLSEAQNSLWKSCWSASQELRVTLDDLSLITSSNIKISARNQSMLFYEIQHQVVTQTSVLTELAQSHNVKLTHSIYQIAYTFRDYEVIIDLSLFSRLLQFIASRPLRATQVVSGDNNELTIVWNVSHNPSQQMLVLDVWDSSNSNFVETSDDPQQLKAFLSAFLPPLNGSLDIFPLNGRSSFRLSVNLPYVKVGKPLQLIAATSTVICCDNIELERLTSQVLNRIYPVHGPHITTLNNRLAYTLFHSSQIIFVEIPLKFNEEHKKLFKSTATNARLILFGDLLDLKNIYSIFEEEISNVFFLDKHTASVWEILDMCTNDPTMQLDVASFEPVTSHLEPDEPPIVKLLVVDDNVFHTSFVTSSFQGSHVSVICASTGNEGINKALEEDPDIVLFDAKLPDLDGFVCARKLYDKGFDRPLILYTAMDEDELAPMYSNSHFTDCLRKPSTLSDLWNMVEKHTKTRRTRTRSNSKVFQY
eukprot:TRINITY_DN2759_c1_g1_i1.p1 TRINITY_DN2759_c1_g1~~TRINITY_DN2759_c1_g1_i1.p1  ORF type:complete len:853 (-),score=171.91 TRINITY_DN2759_c1_g1_i1:924-3482(-)